MAAGLGKAELEFVTSVTAPLYWVLREGDKKYRVRNGSVFFLNAGNGPFAVTAHRVTDGWKQDREQGNVVLLQIGHDLRIDFDGKNSIIATHPVLDIATFRVTSGEIASIKKTVLTGCQSNWPPRAPQQDRGVYFSGFPSVGNIWLSPNEISFGASSGGGVASSDSERDVSSLVERQNLIDVMGHGLPPENYDFRGMSGGPMLMVIETGTLRSWALAGVIYERPNPSPDEAQAIAGLEIIKARRAHLILSDGQLDIRRWDELNPP